MSTPLSDLARRATRRLGSSLCGKYSLRRVIGLGGMAAVYAGVHRNGHPVAIKILHDQLATDPEMERLFRREALLANKVEHSGVVPVIDDDVTEDGCVFLVMPLLEGETVRARAQRAGGKLPVEEVVTIAHAVLGALEAAHAKKIVHRDIKPENIFVTMDAEIKVLDFGIGRFLEPGSPTATRTGRALGTPAFMAPEQAIGRTKEIDGRTDLWALAATMFTLLTGRFVHEGDSADEIAVMAATRPAPKLGELAPEVPEGIRAVVQRALSFDKEERWGGAAEMDRELCAAYEASFEGGPKGLRAPPGRRPEQDDTTAPEHVETEPERSARAPTEELRGPATRTTSRAVVAREHSNRGESESLRRETPRAHWRSPRRLAILGGAGALATAAIVAVVLRGPWHRSRDPGASPPVGSGRGVAITDIPLPASDHPDATEAYSAALVSMRSSNLDEAEDNMKLAITRDPQLAAADLRMIPLVLEKWGGADPAPPYRRALQLRDRLSERDQRMLDAYEPLIETDPADYKQAIRRFEHLAELYPDDAEVADDLARVAYIGDNYSTAMRAVDRALAIDPRFGDAWMLRVEAERSLGRFDEATADADLCFARFASNDCLIERSAVAQFTGAPDTEAIARKQQALKPASYDAASALCGTLFVAGAAPAALHAAFAPAHATISKNTQDYIDGILSVLSGDFAKAHDSLVRWRGNAVGIRKKQARVAWILVNLDEETGDSDAAVRDATAFVEAMPAFARSRLRTFNDPVVPILRVLREHGKLSEEEYQRKRTDFVESSLSQVGPDGRALVWLVAYAMAARTPQEAKEALKTAADFGEPAFQGMGGAPVGHVHLLAGDLPGALPDLQRGARASDVFWNPVASIRARLDLAHALEQNGDKAGACAKYASLLKVWGSAVPRSLSAADARERQRALGCAADD